MATIIALLPVLMALLPLLGYVLMMVHYGLVHFAWIPLIGSGLVALYYLIHFLHLFQ